MRAVPILLFALMVGAVAPRAAGQRSAEQVDRALDSINTRIAEAQNLPDDVLPNLMSMLCGNHLTTHQRIQVATLLAKHGNEKHMANLLEPMLFSKSELDRTELIRKWHISQPYDYTADQSITNQKFPPQIKGEVTWREVTAPDDALINLNSVLGEHENALTYARTRLNVEQAQPVRLALQSDDGLEVILNGETVFVHDAERALNDKPDIVHVLLKPGRNDLWLKIYNIKGEWMFSGRWTRMAMADHDIEAHAAVLATLVEQMQQRGQTINPPEKTLAALLEHDHEQLQTALMRLIGLCKVASLRSHLHDNAPDEARPVALRAAAIASLADLDGENDRKLLIGLADDDALPVIRAHAVLHLHRVDPDQAQKRAERLLATVQDDDLPQALREKLAHIAPPPADDDAD